MQNSRLLANTIRVELQFNDESNFFFQKGRLKIGNRFLINTFLEVIGS